MAELILKFICKSDKVEKLFHRYINLFNNLYENRENTAYFETFSRGFLYILPSFATYKKISETIPTRESIQTILKSKEKKKEEFKQELMEDFHFEPHYQVKFKIEVINYSIEKVLPVMENIFHRIEPAIQFIPKGEKHFTIIFPDLDSFTNYVVIFLNQIRR